MNCKDCGAKNHPGSKFCENCGKSLVQKNIQTKSKGVDIRADHKKQNNNRGIFVINIKTVWAIVGVFACGLVLIASLIIVSSIAEKTVDYPEIKSNDVVLEGKVINIASRFVCNCGDCGSESLTICKCKYAVDTRKMIRDYLEKSVKEEDIIKYVNDKYGGLKRSI